MRAFAIVMGWVLLSTTTSVRAVSFQGELSDGGQPLGGPVDIVAHVYDAPIAGLLLDGPLFFPSVPLEGGRFALDLNINTALYDGAELWIELTVYDPPGGPGVLLSPRTQMSPVAYAYHSLSADWSGLAGMPPGFADGVDNDQLQSLSCGEGQIARLVGGAWQCSSDQTLDPSAFWSTSGNGGTNPAVNWLGTSDAADFVIGTAGLEALRVDAQQRVMIGDAFPFARLFVRGEGPEPVAWFYSEDEFAGGPTVRVVGHGPDGILELLYGGSNIAVRLDAQGDGSPDSGGPGGEFYTNTSTYAMSLSNNGTGAGQVLVSHGPNIPGNEFGNPTLAVVQQETAWAGYFQSGGKGVYISSDAGQPGLQVVGGTKNAVVKTTAGSRALYTEESAEVWFTDYGFADLESGEARVQIDPVFAQTVNLNEPYHVFLQSYSDCRSLTVVRRDTQSFSVRDLDGSGCQGEFSWRLVARRKGYEQTRLEPAPWADAAPPKRFESVAERYESPPD